MIVATNSKPELSEFDSLMSSVDALLNKEAKTSKAIQSSRGAQSLEPIVCDAAIECAKGTPFEGKIDLWSGAHFPDIVAAKYYGIEVKSTIQNHWTSIGSSILESTRIKDVERIYLTFGKLGAPIEFRSRPYEECLSGIAVTHYPRYQIDMTLKAGETIFDKIGIPYDVLRKMDDPVAPVADFYRGKLKPGESLWWAGNKVEAAVPATVKLWSTLSPEEKDLYEAYQFVYFPECILSRGNRKYSRAVLWLATQEGIINPNVRDSFSAGGKSELRNEAGINVLMPQVFTKIKNNIEKFKEVLYNTPPEELSVFWGESIEKNRPLQWLKLVLREENSIPEQFTARSVLRRIFIDNEML